MTLIPQRLIFALTANGLTSRIHAAQGEVFDPRPVVKLFNPVGAATWLASEIDADGDTLFGLADLGFGCPELGCFSLCEIEALRLPFGLAIERDQHFESLATLSVWADTARRFGTIVQAEAALRRRTEDARAGHPRARDLSAPPDAANGELPEPKAAARDELPKPNAAAKDQLPKSNAAAKDELPKSNAAAKDELPPE